MELSCGNSERLLVKALWQGPKYAPGMSCTAVEQNIFMNYDEMMNKKI